MSLPIEDKLNFIVEEQDNLIKKAKSISYLGLRGSHDNSVSQSYFMLDNPKFISIREIYYEIQEEI